MKKLRTLISLHYIEVAGSLEVFSVLNARLLQTDGALVLFAFWKAVLLHFPL